MLPETSQMTSKPSTDCLRKKKYIDMLTLCQLFQGADCHLKLPLKLPASPVICSLVCPEHSVFPHCQTGFAVLLNTVRKKKEEKKKRLKQPGKNREQEPVRSSQLLGSAAESWFCSFSFRLTPYHQDKHFEWISTSKFMLASAGL